MVQFSHPYMTAGKIIALTRQTFVGKVMSLLLEYAVKVCHSFSSKEQVSFNFMAAVKSILGSKDITFLTKIHIVKAMVFPVVMYGCEN